MSDNKVQHNIWTHLYLSLQKFRSCFEYQSDIYVSQGVTCSKTFIEIDFINKLPKVSTNKHIVLVELQPNKDISNKMATVKPTMLSMLMENEHTCT